VSRRRAGRWTLGAVLALLLLVAGALALGVALPRAPDRVFAAVPGEAPVEILVLANPIHTDLVLPATSEVLGRFGFLARDGLPLDHPQLGAVVVGWGGRAFYTQTPRWRDLRADAVWRSVAGDRSVLHVALAPPIDAVGWGEARRVSLPPAAFAALLDFVSASFEPGADGAPQVLPGAGYGAFDLFYEARGRFDILRGCNTWTAAALRRAGLATGAWSPLPMSLLWGLDLHAPAAQEP